VPKKRSSRRTYGELVRDRLRQKRKLYKRMAKIRIDESIVRGSMARALRAIMEYNKMKRENQIATNRFKYLMMLAMTDDITRRAFREFMNADMKDKQTFIKAMRTFTTIWLKEWIEEQREELRRMIHVKRPSEWLKDLRDRLTYYRLVLGTVTGKYKILAMTVYRDPEIRLWFDKGIEEWLRDPERFEATREAFDFVIAQLLAARKRLVVDPETYERLRGIISLIYSQYVAFTREPPCQRSQYIIKLTPLTLHFMGGMGVRFYIVRWTRVDRLMNDRLVIEKPIDVWFTRLKFMKPRDEVFSTMTVGGTSDSLTGDEDVVITRDEYRNPRTILKLYEAMYLPSRIRDESAREIAGYGNPYGFSHCSIYVGLRPHIARKYEKEKWYRREKTEAKVYKIEW